jgi:hypothetical protein
MIFTTLDPKGWPGLPSNPQKKKKKKKKKKEFKNLNKKNYLKAFGYAYKIKIPIWSLPIQFSGSVSDHNVIIVIYFFYRLK